jgi:hypothetical protein
MLSLILAAALGQCSSRASYGYTRSYAAPTYYAQQSYAAPVQYAAPAQTYYQPQQYQAPAYNYSLVGSYLRDESDYKAKAEQNAKLDVLLKLLTERATPPPVQPAPQPPQFQQPYATPQQPSKSPPVQYEAPYPTPQQPSKAPPVEQFQFQAQPSQQQWATPSSQQQWAAPSDQPSFPGKPSPAPSPPTPSFESSGWVPPPASGGGAAAQAVAMMTAGMQARCTDCHVGSNEKGGGVKLLEIDGQLADITPYLKDIADDVISGRMPKKGPRLNPQELNAFLLGLRAYEAQSRARQNVVASFGQ